MNFNPKQ